MREVYQQGTITFTDDPVFPGENWFYYWKTSPSLWESKIRAYSGSHILFVPLYWGLHHEKDQDFDFGQKKPETDLYRLQEVASKLGKRVVFLMPLSPFPFLPFGGVPQVLAQFPVCEKTGLIKATVDHEGQVHTLGSFFDPKVFQGHKKFLWALAQYFNLKKMRPEVYGLIPGFNQDGQFVSFKRDFSLGFTKSFERFLEQQRVRQQNSLDTQERLLIENPNDEMQLTTEFLQLMDDLYAQSCLDAFGPLWGGVVKATFLGGTPSDLVARSFDMELSVEEQIASVFQMINHQSLPSTALLTPQQKNPLLLRVMSDLIDTGMIQTKLRSDLYEDDFVGTFFPLRLFDIFIPLKKSHRDLSLWDDLELKEFFDRFYRWTYVLHHQLVFDLSSEDFRSKVYFIPGHALEKEHLGQLLKLFMGGAKIVIDRTGMELEREKKLQLFFMENALPVEKINSHTQLMKVTLGDGCLVLFDGQKLKDKVYHQKLEFWKLLIEHLDLDHLNVEADDAVYFYWRVRGPRPQELRFEQIRRVSLYNPSKEKQKAKIFLQKNFMFLKILDESNCQVQTNRLAVEIELQPHGSVSLDFGYFDGDEG